MRSVGGLSCVSGEVKSGDRRRRGLPGLEHSEDIVDGSSSAVT